MKAKTFENLIRKVVREEIDYSLRREIKSLKEDLRDELKPTITEHKERMVEVPKDTMPETAKSSLREKTGLNIFIKNKRNNKGLISFEYRDLDQLNRIIEVIKSNY